MMNVDPKQTIFYTIEKSIKAYRKYAQTNISQTVTDITLDQILILTVLNSDTEISQKEIAQVLFKDYASITRMIELLVKKGYLSRNIHQEDRRKFQLVITDKGLITIEKLKPIIFQNRSDALFGLSDTEIKQLCLSLNKIINNCTK